jgi:hypothetical protein
VDALSCACALQTNKLTQIEELQNANEALEKWQSDFRLAATAHLEALQKTLR